MIDGCGASGDETWLFARGLNTHRKTSRGLPAWRSKVPQHTLPTVPIPITPICQPPPISHPSCHTHPWRSKVPQHTLPTVLIPITPITPICHPPPHFTPYLSHTPFVCHTPHFTPRVPPIVVAFLIRQPLWSSQALGEHSEAFCHPANLLFARDRAWGRGGRSQPRGHPRAGGGLFLSRGALFLSFSY